ncbi:PAS domain-containing protein [Sphingomonas qilianensis]|uniref:histidine kinase n=1 Tax=Sphingomonas qilianensis TaxID=1736690 RepID=A0ABU9XVE3_9SPHN
MYRHRHLIALLPDAGTPLPAWHREDTPFLPSLPAAWQCDLATDRLSWSIGVFDLFGIPRDAAIDRRSTLDLYMPESRLKLEQVRAAALETGGSFTIEVQIRRVDGELRWIRISAAVQCENGRPTVIHGTKQDITAEMAGYRSILEPMIPRGG